MATFCIGSITAALPVIVNGMLVGVAAAHIHLIDALKKETHLAGDGDSYYFLITRNGDTFYHPMLPQPMCCSNMVAQHIVVFIGLLEKDSLNAGVLALMMRYDLYIIHILCSA